MRTAEEVAVPPAAKKGYDVYDIRPLFPILQIRVNGRPLVYLDNAATTQKPETVIRAIERYYSEENSNIHRGVHFLSQRATTEYEAVRSKIKHFINASSEREIIFVRGTTEGINLVATSFVKPRLQNGDEVIISGMEHHSNIVPWQMVCEEKEARLKVVPINDRGELILEEYKRLLTSKTKFVSLTHISNALGTVNPVKDLIEMAHKRDIPVLIDGAQAVSHQAVDVRDLDCDFYAFSGHKMFGPTGIGVLYGKEELLEHMSPYQGGGDMIKSVTFEKTIYNDLPYKFEAGTPNIAGVIGLGSAVDFLMATGIKNITFHETDLLNYATEAVVAIKGLRIIGTAKAKSAVLSFVLEDVHPHDIGTIIDSEGVAIRTGHHCSQPVMQRFGVPATARASFALYNTRDEIDALISALHKVKKVFS
jgi:cysteine desulfurase / selenocysteine lyase